MKPHSLALREQIVAAYKNNEGSMLKLACKFGVSRSFVQKIIKQERLTGSVRPIGCGNRQSKLEGQDKLVKELLEKNPNYTLKEMCFLIQQQTSIQVCPSTMARFIHKIHGLETI